MKNVILYSKVGVEEKPMNKIFERVSEGAFKHLAFTLAEVLITLGIIGIVAAMTIPTLISKYEEKSTVSKLLKLYSTLNQAYLSIQAEEGPITNWSGYPRESDADFQQNATEYVFEQFKPYLKIARDCGYDAGCFPDGNYKRFDGGNTISLLTGSSTKRRMVMLSDGSTIAFTGHTKNYEGYVWLYVDTNGLHGPNTFGVDFFEFHLHENTILPGGIENEYGDYLQRCYGFGDTCAYWIISHKNMDYMNCSDLALGVKESCK